MSAPTDKLNPLSCTRCRDRKIKCNRVMPQCGKCKASNASCAYPARQKRRMNKVEGRSLVASSNEALHSILDRLRRLEAQTPATPDTPVASPLPLPLPLAPPLSSSASPAAVAATRAVLDSCPSVGQRDHESSFSAGTCVGTTTANTPSSHRGRRKGFDVNAVILEATNRVQKLRLQSFGSSAIADPITIPKDVAKQCVAAYFARKPDWSWANVVDKELMQLLPDILGRPHVHVDPVIVVIYYSLLYNEIALNQCRSSNVSFDRYLKQCYLGCLRSLQAWQREASGSLADFVAALMITNIAAESFDFDMSWKMFKLACEYCKSLNLHNLDALPAVAAADISDEMLDRKRKDMWVIVQIDLFFRLIHNMPPALTDNAWNVNLPWLAVDPSLLPDVVESTAFLASSRFTLVIARFFAIMDEVADNDADADRAELRLRVEGLCQEILTIYDEYDVNSWLDKIDDNGKFWTIADVLLMGYTSIMHMVRRVDVFGIPDAPDALTHDGIPYSPIVVNAARNLVASLSRILIAYPRAETMIAILGAYQGYLPFSVLAITVLDSDFSAADTYAYAAAAADLRLLDTLVDQVVVLGRGHRDITPLTFAMQLVNDEVRAKIEACAGGEYSVHG